MEPCVGCRKLVFAEWREDEWLHRMSAVVKKSRSRSGGRILSINQWKIRRAFAGSCGPTTSGIYLDVQWHQARLLFPTSLVSSPVAVPCSSFLNFWAFCLITLRTPCHWLHLIRFLILQGHQSFTSILNPNCPTHLGFLSDLNSPFYVAMSGSFSLSLLTSDVKD